MAVQMLGIKTKFTDDQGRPLIGGSVHTYYAGTSLPQDTFSDPELTVPNTNPVKLDDTGSANIFLKGTYRVRVFDRNGKFVEEQDNISQVFDSASAKILSDKLDALPFEGGVLADTFVTARVNVDGAVTRNQRSINSQIITPFDFGAIGDGKTHPLSERYSTLALAQEAYPHATSLNDEIDWCSIQAMLDIARTREFKRHTLNWGGRWHLNKTVKFNATSGSGEYRSIYGDFRFSVTDDFEGDAVIEFHGRGITQSGVISGDARNLVEFGIIADRRGVGDAIDHINYGIKLDRIFINNCLLYAVSFGGNAMFSTLEFIRTTGNGISSIYAGKKLTAVISNKVNSNVGEINSSSVLTVDVLPPTYSSKGKTFIVVGGEISLVSSVNRTNSTITVKPHISKSEVELSYILGGGVSIRGSDSANIHIKQMSVLGSGIAVDHSPMYPALISSLTTEYCGIGLYEQGLVGGANVVEYYTEGNTFDYVSGATQGKTYGSTSILHGTLPKFDKYALITFGRKSDGNQHGLYGGANGISVREKGLLHRKVPDKLPRNIVPNHYFIDFNEPHQNKVYYTNSTTVAFAKIDPAYNRIFAYDSQEFTIVGTGENKSPTQVSFAPPSGYTINGSASNAVFKGFTGAAKFVCFLRVDSKDIVVSCTTLQTVVSSTYDEMPSGVDVKSLPLDVTYYFTAYASTNNSEIPLPSNGVGQYGVITKRYSHRPVGGSHYITQEVRYEQLGEVWRRFYNSASGTYGSWSLVEYTVKKGTTAQRPSRPTLGHRYFDTTLISTGQPITWNGSAWVDGMGVAV